MTLLYLLDEPVPYTVTYDDGTTEEIVPRWQLHFRQAMERLPRVSENHALYHIGEEDSMTATGVDQPQTKADDRAALVSLVERLASRVELLEKEVLELNEWLGEVADDVLDREGVA